MTHSPEPWRIEDVYRLIDANGNVICQFDDRGYGPPNECNRQRIVACVNACRSLPTEYLQWVATEGRHLLKGSTPLVETSMAKFEKMIDKPAEPVCHVWENQTTCHAECGICHATLHLESDIHYVGCEHIDKYHLTPTPLYKESQK